MPSSIGINERCPYACLARPLHDGCPVYEDNVIVQVCEGVWTPHGKSVLETMRSITLRSPVARRNISGAEAIAATLVVPGKQSNSLSTSWIASPVYDPAEKPRTSTSLIPSGTGTVTDCGKQARRNSSLP